jgi:hypothetical protein
VLRLCCVRGQGWFWSRLSSSKWAVVAFLLVTLSRPSSTAAVRVDWLTGFVVAGEVIHIFPPDVLPFVRSSPRRTRKQGEIPEHIRAVRVTIRQARGGDPRVTEPRPSGARSIPAFEIRVGRGLVDEVAEGALEVQGFGGEGAGVRAEKLKFGKQSTLRSLATEDGKAEIRARGSAAVPCPGCALPHLLRCRNRTRSPREACQ